MNIADGKWKGKIHAFRLSKVEKWYCNRGDIVLSHRSQLWWLVTEVCFCFELQNNLLRYFINRTQLLTFVSSNRSFNPTESQCTRIFTKFEIEESFQIHFRLHLRSNEIFQLIWLPVFCIPLDSTLYMHWKKIFRRFTCQYGYLHYLIIIKFGMGHISNQSENLTPHSMIVTRD